MNNISVIIRTKDSQSTIEDCIVSIRNQSFAVSEIIIVDSGSNDKTLEIAASHNCKILKYQSNGLYNYSKALNMGIAEARGDFLLIMSSHTRFLGNNDLNEMIVIFQEWKQIVSVSYNRTGLPDYDNSGTSKYKVSSFGNFDGLAMYNLCSLIKKQDWEIYHFNENMPTAEDQEWAKYFIRRLNRVSIIIYNKCVFYSNSHYNYQKDINEYFAIGRYVDNKWFSKIKIIELIMNLFGALFKFQFSKSNFYFKLIVKIIRYKLTGFSEITFYRKK